MTAVPVMFAVMTPATSVVGFQTLANVADISCAEVGNLRLGCRCSFLRGHDRLDSCVCFDQASFLS